MSDKPLSTQNGSRAINLHKTTTSRSPKEFIGVEIERCKFNKNDFAAWYKALKLKYRSGNHDPAVF